MWLRLRCQSGRILNCWRQRFLWSSLSVIGTVWVRCWTTPRHSIASWNQENVPIGTGPMSWSGSRIRRWSSRGLLWWTACCSLGWTSSSWTRSIWKRWTARISTTIFFRVRNVLFISWKGSITSSICSWIRSPERFWNRWKNQPMQEISWSVLLSFWRQKITNHRRPAPTSDSVLMNRSIVRYTKYWVDPSPTTEARV